MGLGVQTPFEEVLGSLGIITWMYGVIRERAFLQAERYKKKHPEHLMARSAWLYPCTRGGSFHGVNGVRVCDGIFDFYGSVLGGGKFVTKNDVGATRSLADVEPAGAEPGVVQTVGGGEQRRRPPPRRRRIHSLIVLQVYHGVPPLWTPLCTFSQPIVRRFLAIGKGWISTITSQDNSPRPTCLVREM